MKTVYWQKLIIPFFAVVLLFFSTKTRANHIMGADIGWKYVAGDTFLFTASVYRSCDGIPLANTPFKYFSDCAGYTAPTTVYGTMCCTKDVTPDLGWGCTRCGGIAGCNNPYGIQLILISARIVFPKGCCHWYVSWDQSSRDGAITTGAAGKNFYTEAEIDICENTPKDNSPQFKAPALTIFCLNQCQQVDYSATDPDHNTRNKKDSLFYSLVPPLQAHNSAISYAKGYSYLSPIKNIALPSDTSACKNFSIDQTSGMLHFQPMKTDLSVMAIKVDEYRPDSIGNLHKIGSVRRDVEIIIDDCRYNTNHPPVLTGINGGTSTNIKICEGTQTCFSIKSFDQDPKDTVSMTWDSIPPGATLNIVDKTKKWPTATFCWHPKLSDVRTTPYKFTVYVTDNAFPLKAKASKVFNIFVSEAPKASYSIRPDNCGSASFSAEPAGSSTISIADYSWTGDDINGYGPLFANGNRGKHQYAKPGKYHVQLTVTSPNGCMRTYDDSVVIPPFPNVSLSHHRDTVVCEKSPIVSLKATPLHGQPPFSFKWNTGETTDTKTATIARDTVFKVSMTDGTGCGGSDDDIHIRFQKVPIPHPATHILTCAKSKEVLQTKLSSQVIWTWIAGGKTNPNFSTDNPLITGDSGLYIATALNGAACPGTDSFIITYVKRHLRSIDSIICYGDTIHFNKYFHGLDTTFLATQPEYRLFGTIFHDLGNGFNCLDTCTIILHTRPKINTHLFPIPDQCVHNGPLLLDPYVDKAHYGGYWYSATRPKSVIADYLYPTAMGVTGSVKNKGYIHYQYMDPYGCHTNDSIKVRVFDKPNAGPDVSIWRECGRYMLNTNALPLKGGTWSAAPGTNASSLEISGDTAYFNPDSVSGYGKFGFVYSYKASSGSSLCDGADTVFINIMPRTQILIKQLDSLCENFDPVLLEASPSGGIWQFADSTNPGALIHASGKTSVIPAVAGPGTHTLIYTFSIDALHPLCKDTGHLEIAVGAKPIIDFTTSDHKSSYCSSASPVLLVPNIKGGYFTGDGLIVKGDSTFFNPGAIVSNYGTVIYNMPYVGGKCVATITHAIDVSHAPEVHFLNDTVMCADNNSFLFKAQLKNVSRFLWHSIFNNQDGGFFTEEHTSDSFSTIRFFTSPEQIKQNHFNISMTAFGIGVCDSVHLQYNIHIKAGPQPDFISDRQGCEPFTTQFKQNSTTPSGNITGYEWVFGDSTPHSFIAEPYHTYRQDSIAQFNFFDVKLSVSTDEGCRTTINKKGWIIVNGAPHPVIKVLPNFTTLDRSTIQFGIGPGSQNMDTTDTATKYLWYFIDEAGTTKSDSSTLQNPLHTYKDTGRFSVILKVINGDGCVGIDSAYRIINIRPAFAIFIPNAFMPGTNKNGKPGINSYFKPVITSAAYYDMRIYNRWGELIYSAKDSDTGWDGTFREQPAPADTYIYYIRVNSLWAEPHVYKGTVNLLR